MPDLTELADWATIAALFVSVIAVGVSILLYLQRRERRALACHFDPVVSPIEIKTGDALDGDIEIRYKGQPVENLFTVRATIRNTGNVPIRKSEIIEPVTFDFGSDAKLVRRPKIIHTQPDNLEAEWLLPGDPEPESGIVHLSTRRIRESQAALLFDLLNPKEELTTEFVCTGEAAIPKPSARIVGITSIQVGEASTGSRTAGWIWLGLLGVFIVGVIVASLTDPSKLPHVILLYLLGMIILTLVFPQQS